MSVQLRIIELNISVFKVFQCQTSHTNFRFKSEKAPEQKQQMTSMVSNYRQVVGKVVKPRAYPGILNGEVGPNFDSDILLKPFCGKLLIPIPPSPLRQHILYTP